MSTTDIVFTISTVMIGVAVTVLYGSTNLNPSITFVAEVLGFIGVFGFMFSYILARQKEKTDRAKEFYNALGQKASLELLIEMVKEIKGLRQDLKLLNAPKNNAESGKNGTPKSND